MTTHLSCHIICIPYSLPIIPHNGWWASNFAEDRRRWLKRQEMVKIIYSLNKIITFFVLSSLTHFPIRNFFLISNFKEENIWNCHFFNVQLLGRKFCLYTLYYPTTNIFQPLLSFSFSFSSSVFSLSFLFVLPNPPSVYFSSSLF